jgi:hypothetical protein
MCRFFNVLKFSRFIAQPYTNENLYFSEKGIFFNYQNGHMAMCIDHRTLTQIASIPAHDH